MFKKLLSAMLIVTAISTVLPCVTQAAFSNTISLSEKGNSENVIYIKRPESHQASTSDRTYTISAVGEQGTKVRVYKYNPATGVCGLIKKTPNSFASGSIKVISGRPFAVSHFDTALLLTPIRSASWV